MEFFAYHGVFGEERKVGCKYLVTITLNTDLSKAGESDNLADTINYENIYAIIKKEMETNSNLIEHVAKRIITSVKRIFPQILTVNLKIAKLNPPIGGQIESAIITWNE